MSMRMQKRSWESEKNNRDHDPEHLVHISVVDHVCVGADWNGEVEMGRLIDADMLIAELKESAAKLLNPLMYFLSNSLILGK